MPKTAKADRDPGLVSAYPQLTVRLPPATKHRLDGWSALSGEAIWRLVDSAVLAAIARLPEGERKAIEALAAVRDRKR
jgi:hypothetical protein